MYRSGAKKVRVYCIILSILIHFSMELPSSYGSLSSQENVAESKVIPTQEKIIVFYEENTQKPIGLITNVGHTIHTIENAHTVTKIEEQSDDVRDRQQIIVPPKTPDINIHSDRSQCPMGYYGLWTNPKDCKSFINCGDVSKAHVTGKRMQVSNKLYESILKMRVQLPNNNTK